MIKEIEARGYKILRTGEVLTLKGKPFRGTIVTGGYRQINVGKFVLVHRLVALKYLGEPPTPEHVVNHKDGNPLNNHADNLEWVTHHENQLHKYGHAVYLDDKKAAVRELAGRGLTQRQIAKMIGVCQKSVSNWLR